MARSVRPPANHDDDFIVFLTTVVSHGAIVPALIQLYRRRWTYEFVISVFAVFTSFMYHFCQAFHTELYLTELQWHRLDNIGAISCFGLIFIHFCCFKRPEVDLGMKYFSLLLAILCQERYPWRIEFTVVPIAFFIAMPLVVHGLYHRARPPWDMKELAVGLMSLVVAIPFFVLGLDDDHDPFRVFHGMWHLMGGLAALHMWRVVKHHPSHPDREKPLL